MSKPLDDYTKQMEMAKAFGRICDREFARACYLVGIEEPEQVEGSPLLAIARKKEAA